MVEVPVCGFAEVVDVVAAVWVWVLASCLVVPVVLVAFGVVVVLAGSSARTVVAARARAIGRDRAMAVLVNFVVIFVGSFFLTRILSVGIVGEASRPGRGGAGSV